VAPSIGKLLGTELKQRLTEIGLTIAGAYAAARLPMAECAECADIAGSAHITNRTDAAADAATYALALPEDAIFAMSAYLNDRAASIYAGTNEVQRNLIAQHLLAT